jgi:hypothetical protein
MSLVRPEKRRILSWIGKNCILTFLYSWSHLPILKTFWTSSEFEIFEAGRNVRDSCQDFVHDKDNLILFWLFGVVSVTFFITQ